MRLINGHRESIFQGKLEILGFKNISLVIKGIRGTSIVPHREKIMVSRNISIQPLIKTTSNSESITKTKIKYIAEKLRTKRILN